MSTPISAASQKKQLALRYVNSALAVGGVAAVLLLLLAMRQGWIKLDRLLGESQEEVQSAPAAEARVSCTLTPEKMRDAGLHEAVTEIRTIREERTVPGSITYNEARHLVLTAPVDCVAVQTLTEPGKNVDEGTPLVILSSAAVGVARDEVLQREAELALAQKARTWGEEIAKNTQELLAQLKQRPALPDLEKELAGKKLGDYREKVVGAYSKLILAELAIEAAESLSEQGAVAKKLFNERRSARETAAAAFASACETSRFDSIQAADKATATEQQAARLLTVSREHLAALLGPFADMSSVGGRENLSEFTVRAPFAGRIEERHVVTAARLMAGDPLYALADTRQMRVSAEIHERDWKALDLKPGEELTIRVPALVEASFQAKVLYIGSQVSPETRAVPLVADIVNDEGKFKPGMFVWVEVPLTVGKKALVVPAAAIIRHEDQPFVFVPDGNNTFRRVDVQTGLETREAVEILSGLKAGDKVIDQGAFVLKSEMLLEREE